MQNNPLSGVVLGLDIGDVRIGVARSHSIAKLPEPLEVITRTKQDAVARMRELVQEYQVEGFVLGIPMYKSGQEGPQAEAVRAFAKELYKALPLPQVFVDESFTSQEADRYKSSKAWQHQATNDALAACLILERYFAEVLHHV